MSNADKARQFLALREQGDPRCAMLVMMLAITCRITEDECLRRITTLAE